MSADIDLTVPVRDTVHLASLPAAVDRLLQQCHDVGAPRMTAIRRVADSVTLDFSGPLDDLLPLRLFSSLSVVLGEHPEGAGAAEAVVAALRESLRGGVLGALTPAPAFRVDAFEGQAEIIEAITSTLGWRNDPHAWDVNVVRSGPLLLAQVGALHRSRRYPRLERIPASVNPVVAALVTHLLKAGPQDVVLDPFCGSGTFLVEADAAGRGGLLLGGDTALPALRAAQRNTAALERPVGLLHARAQALPLPSHRVDRIVSNLPFGKRVGSHRHNEELYPAFLAEVTRVLTARGRAVLMTEDKRLFERSVQATHGLRVIREVRLSSGGLHPSAYVLERTRTQVRTLTRGARAGSLRGPRAAPTPSATPTG